MPSNINHILRFFGLLLFQTIILNNINVNGLINPYIYPLFIMLLPLSIHYGLLLVLSFLMGLGIDIFSNTAGLHAFTSVFIAFIRPAILRALAAPGGYESENKPTINSLGIRWFLSYSLVIIFIHHTILFFMEVFSFNLFGRTILRIILSSIISIILIVIFEYLFYPKKK